MAMLAEWNIQRALAVNIPSEQSASNGSAGWRRRQLNNTSHNQKAILSTSHALVRVQTPVRSGSFPGRLDQEIGG